MPYQREDGQWVLPLSQGLVALIDEEDVSRVSAHQWHASKQTTAGRYYVSTRIDGVVVSLHRFLLGDPPAYVDHRNTDSLDNRRTNLRLATMRQNAFNRGPNKANTSGYKGVTLEKRTQRWVGQIHTSGKHIHLGTFDTAEDAARAYDAKARELLGPFAWLNFPDEPLG